MRGANGSASTCPGTRRGQVDAVPGQATRSRAAPIFRRRAADRCVASNLRCAGAGLTSRRSGRRIVGPQTMGFHSVRVGGNSPRVPRDLPARVPSGGRISEEHTRRVTGCAAGADRWPNFLVGVAALSTARFHRNLLTPFSSGSKEKPTEVDLRVRGALVDARVLFEGRDTGRRF